MELFVNFVTFIIIGNWLFGNQYTYVLKWIPSQWRISEESHNSVNSIKLIAVEFTWIEWKAAWDRVDMATAKNHG